MSIEWIEAQDTFQITYQTSVAPDSAPNLAVLEPFGFTAIHSGTMQTSGPLAFYEFISAPNSPGVYLFEIFAQKTLISSIFTFTERGCFRVERTQIPRHL